MRFKDRARHWVKTGQLPPAEKEIKLQPSLGLNQMSLLRYEMEQQSNQEAKQVS